MRFADMTTKELKEHAKSYYEAIYNADCYGSHDIRNLDGVMTELNKRGIELYEHGTLTFSDEED